MTKVIFKKEILYYLPLVTLIPAAYYGKKYISKRNANALERSALERSALEESNSINNQYNQYNSENYRIKHKQNIILPTEENIQKLQNLHKQQLERFQSIELDTPLLTKRLVNFKLLNLEEKLAMQKYEMENLLKPI